MFSRDNTWTNAAKMGQEEWYEMYVRPFHRELIMPLGWDCLGDLKTGWLPRPVLTLARGLIRRLSR